MLNGGGGIKPEDAAAFISTLNEIQRYVPPIVFNQLASNPIAMLLAEVANRRAELAITPTAIAKSESMTAQ